MPPGDGHFTAGVQLSDKRFLSAEFSRPVAVDRLGPEEAFDIAPSASERAALAKRFGLISLDGLEAKVTLCKLDDARRVRLSATFSVDVVQSCVVTLEPVSSHIEDSFVLVYDEGAEEPRKAIFLLEDEDPPEPLIDGVIDVGEAVAEHLALALDPYPRARGADLAALDPSRGGRGGSAEGEAPDSPFRVLARRKGKG